MELYIGLMSGTSADGIDAALVDFDQAKPQVIATHYEPYPQILREKILALCHKGENEIQRLGELDIILGKEFAQAANHLLRKQGVSARDIIAIGSHGQSIRHHPHEPHRFTMQIGDPNTIAAETGITTVADFRRKDIAYGGQGAPLVPAFHQHILSSDKIDRAVVNIGGIANVTFLLRKNPEEVTGFDTGPGNALMDAWIYTHKNVVHDKNGEWGVSGKIQPALLASLLSDDYFKLAPPKSTGREHFNLAWLRKHLDTFTQPIPPEDVQATLAELTANSIMLAVRNAMTHGEILICGGGAHNHFLMSRLIISGGKDLQIASTQQYGIDPDWLEAMAFAWLARQTMHKLPGNLPRVTGAKQLAVLGGIFYSG